MKSSSFLPRLGASLALAVLGLARLQAAPDHSVFFTGEYATGPEVTSRCLDCHSGQAEDFKQTRAN